jgi:hypothetical protein
MAAFREVSRDARVGFVYDINPYFHFVTILLLDPDGKVSEHNHILQFSKIKGFDGRNLEQLKKFGQNGFEVGIIVSIELYNTGTIKKASAILDSDLCRALIPKRVPMQEKKTDLLNRIKNAIRNLFSVPKKIPF